MSQDALPYRFVKLAAGRVALWHNPAAAGLPKLLLGHGNGLGSLCQIGLIRALGAHFDVHAMDFRGHGATELPLPATPEDPWGWYVQDLAAVIEQCFNGHVTYVGHSLAGVAALRLALRRPELFAHLTAIDPAILPTAKARLYPLARSLGLTRRVNRLYNGALVRRDRWPDRETAVAYFTGRKAFATWPEEAVAGYVDGCMKPCPGGQSASTAKDTTPPANAPRPDTSGAKGGLRLACPREWEARTFKYVPTEIERILPKISVPTLIIRAENGSIVPQALRVNARTCLTPLAGTHFIHIEQPKAVAAEIIRRAL